MTGAECVSAPTEMKSTPVSAMRADGVERDAARGLELRAAGDELDGLAHLGRGHVVEQDDVGAGVERLADVVERLRLDLDRQVRAGRAERARPRRGRRRRAGGGCP